MATGLAEKVADAVEGWLLPAVPYGDTAASNGFPGTVSLSFATVRAIAGDICRSLKKQGFPCLIVVNGDYGNRAALGVAARDALDELDWPVLVVNYPGLAEIAAQICESTPAAPGFYHADEVETSMMLALRPDLVHMDRAEAAYPLMPETLGSVPTQLALLSPTGVFGDPRPADGGKGRQLLDLLAAEAVALARSFLAALGHVP
jgi:creatinine amidohydrolase